VLIADEELSHGHRVDPPGDDDEFRFDQGFGQVVTPVAVQPVQLITSACALWSTRSAIYDNVPWQFPHASRTSVFRNTL
jgi:hypothetical protein